MAVQQPLTVRLPGMYAHFKLQKNALNSVQGIKNVT